MFTDSAFCGESLIVSLLEAVNCKLSAGKLFRIKMFAAVTETVKDEVGRGADIYILEEKRTVLFVRHHCSNYTKTVPSLESTVLSVMVRKIWTFREELEKFSCTVSYTDYKLTSPQVKAVNSYLCFSAFLFSIYRSISVGNGLRLQEREQLTRNLKPLDSKTRVNTSEFASHSVKIATLAI